MSKMDYAEHERTYSGFLTLAKWTTVALVILLALMGFFLT
ncbi:aa3-type cytochrome c oxidase subunit IV [Pseudoxanthobacter sp. M-2]